MVLRSVVVLSSLPDMYGATGGARDGGGLVVRFGRPSSTGLTDLPLSDLDLGRSSELEGSGEMILSSGGDDEGTCGISIDTSS